MQRLIVVEPAGDGWMVRVDDITEPTLFLNGSDAESTAKRLGQRLAIRGDTAEVRVFLRDGALAGRFLFSPERPFPRFHVESADLPSGAGAPAAGLQ